MICRVRLTLLTVLALAGCRREAACARCDVIVIAATGEPKSILPPVVVETVGRDIGDQIFERLADLAPGGAPIDTAAYRPRLAARWERVDPVTLRFHLRPNARWQDGEPVTAGDVVFSFEAFTDSLLDPPARAALSRVASVTPEDSTTVAVHFSAQYPEQLYDATFHVRVFPAHIWRWIGRDAWGADTAVSRLVGSGPYRIARWDRGQSLTLVADTVGGRRTKLGTAIWRFAADPEAALNLVLAGEADLLETLGSPERAARVEADSGLRTLRYPAAVYGYLGYQLASGSSRASAVADRRVRQALNMGIDRAGVAAAIYGPGSKAPPGPMSQLLWIWDDSIAVLPYDAPRAARELTDAGWAPGRDGIRRKDGRTLGLDILVPSTSLGRKRLAEALQEQWRRLGVAVTITAVDFPLFMERLGKGNFESYIGAWLNEPSPRGLADQWTAAGLGQSNYGRYTNPAFDQLVGKAGATEDPRAARLIWRAAFDTLNADAPALFLYAPVNVAAVSRRVVGFELNPYSWLSGLPSVTLKPQ
jgi:peptide/nickel transport system substrate-binding protein